MQPAISPLVLVEPPAPAADVAPVPADVQAVLDLFTTHLATVSFPDVDAATLRARAEDLHAATSSVARAREGLARALADTEARRAALADAAARAIAYARIYAAAHPDRQPILAALARLEPPCGSSSPAAEPRRRGRPRKVREAAELFEPAPPR